LLENKDLLDRTENFSFDICTFYNSSESIHIRSG